MRGSGYISSIPHDSIWLQCDWTTRDVREEF